MPSFSRLSLVRLAALASAMALAAAAGSINVSHAQSGGYDAAFFKALKWRNVGPARGGR